jgi:hypothetical protein
MCAIGWRDKIHKKCFFGDFREEQAEQVRFYQNENGEYDTNSAICDEGRKLALTIEFPKETRLLLGVAVVKKDNNDGEHGTQLESLDYTEQNVITLKDCNERIVNKII